MMPNDGTLRSRDVIVEFIREYLMRREKSWEPHDYEQMVKQWQDYDYYHSTVNTVVECLLFVTDEMSKFIESTQNKAKFDEMAQNLTSRIRGSRSIQTTAFEEIIVRVVDTSEITLDVQDKMVNDIIKWMCKYIDRNLVCWINAKDGNWESIMDDPVYERACESTAARSQARSKPSVRNYFGRIGLAAVAILAGSLYLGSKLAVQ